MAIEIKRQQLLDKKPKGKKPESKTANKPQPQKVPQQAQQKQTKSAAQVNKSSGIKKFFQLILVLFMIGLIIVPKPKLLVYQKLGLVANSVYIPGWFGAAGHIIDSSQRVIIEENLGLVYFCYQKDQPIEHCNRYTFVEEKGMISAFIHYKNNNY